LVQNIAEPVGGVKKESGHLLNGMVLKNGKILVHALQWYITHTCNLTCSNCSNFNNFAITGHDKIRRVEDEVAAWGQKLHVNDFCIIGGEPFTNRELHEWAVGLREHFTCRDFRIVTNGTLLRRFAKQIPEWIDKKITIEVSLHSEKHFQKALNDIHEILNGKYERYIVTKRNHIKGIPMHVGCGYDEAILVDGFPAFIIVYKTKFYKWGVKEKQNDVWRFFNSDRELAHETCFHKHTPYIYKGKMYKCGTIVGAQGFAQKYPLTQEDKDLITSYKPIDAMSNNLVEQIQSLNDSIPQCVICPVNNNIEEDIILDSKKILP
jgi:organic radical activating enzyme